MLTSNGFVEVADRALVARYTAWDVTVGLVLGSHGALVAAACAYLHLSASG